MSRPYRIYPQALPAPVATVRKAPVPVTGTATGRSSCTVVVDDATVTKIALEKILPEPAMKDILKETAKNNGWKSSTCGNEDELHKDSEEVELTLDMKNLTVTAVAKKVAKIELEESAKVTALPGEIKNATAKAAKELDAKLAAQVDEIAEKQKTEFEKQVSEALTKTEETRKKELNELMLQIYAEALKKKAASLGTITSLKEGKNEDGEYEITIKVTE